MEFHGVRIYPSAYGSEDEDDAATNVKIDVSYKNYTLYYNNSGLGSIRKVQLQLLSQLIGYSCNYNYNYILVN